MQTKLLSTTTNKRFYKDVASLKKDRNSHSRYQLQPHQTSAFLGSQTWISRVHALIQSIGHTPTYSSLVIFIGGTKIASLPLSGEDELSATEPRMNYHSKSNQVLMEQTFELKPVAITIAANATELSIWLQQGWGLVLAT